MPFLGSKNGHEPIQERIQGYLEKGGRALARDFVNLHTPDERRAWGYFMDRTRTRAGNDVDVAGRTVTYRHFVLSPDPEDAIDLASLRELTMGWVHHFFGDDVGGRGALGAYEVAVVYHDDNALGIPHAHVIVNNTDLDTGRRLHIDAADNEGSLPDKLQELAKERGLRYFDNTVNGEKKRSSAGRYYTKIERELIKAGRFSWKEDLRNNIEVAWRLAASAADFESTLKRLHIGFEERDGEYLYSHPSNPGSWRCGAYKLGKAFTKGSIERAISISRRNGLPRSDVLRENVEDYVMHDYFPEMKTVAVVAHSVTAEQAAHALRVIDAYDLRSLDGFKRQISRLESSPSRSSSLAADRVNAQIGSLKRAMETVESASFFEGVSFAGPSPHRLAGDKSPANAAGAGGGSAGKRPGPSARRNRAVDDSRNRRLHPGPKRSGRDRGGDAGWRDGK